MQRFIHDTSNQPTVSVITISYNHARYIEKAIESILLQEDIDFELIISDDASTDTTPKLIKKHSISNAQIVPILHKKNVGITNNLIGAMNKARGKYIALCEGDDFWIDPKKLRKQVDYMEKHPSTSVLFHPVEVIDEDGGEKFLFPNESTLYFVEKSFTLTNLLRHNYIQTNSVMYKNIGPYSGIFQENALPLDWLVHVYHAMQGSIGYQKDVMAAYRKHGDSVWHRDNRTYDSFWSRNGKRHLMMYENMREIIKSDAGLTENLEASFKSFIQTMIEELSSVDHLDTAKTILKNESSILVDTLNEVILRERKANQELEKEKLTNLEQTEEMDQLRVQTNDKEKIIQEQTSIIKDIHSSHSWKITYPLRYITNIVKRSSK